MSNMGWAKRTIFSKNYNLEKYLFFCSFKIFEKLKKPNISHPEAVQSILLPIPSFEN